MYYGEQIYLRRDALSQYEAHQCTTTLALSRLLHSPQEKPNYTGWGQALPEKWFGTVPMWVQRQDQRLHHYVHQLHSRTVYSVETRRGSGHSAHPASISLHSGLGAHRSGRTTEGSD